MKVSEAKYQQIALADPQGQWELDCGRLRRKPPMTFEHNQVASILCFRLQSQLSLQEYTVRMNSERTRRTDKNYYIPDVMVIPMSITGPLRHRRDVLEAYDQPLPLVVEVWSPSTGRYDVDSKLPEYQRRGDREIWRLPSVRANADRVDASARRRLHGDALPPGHRRTDRSPERAHRLGRGVQPLTVGRQQWYG
jgi:Uma2 family endonuclease